MMPLKMATTKKPLNRLYQPSMIVGLKGTKTSSPSVPKTRRAATNVNGDISATATLIKRKEAPHNADKTKSTRYSLGFMRLILLSVENAVYHTKTLGNFENLSDLHHQRRQALRSHVSHRPARTKTLRIRQTLNQHWKVNYRTSHRNIAHACYVMS